MRACVTSQYRAGRKLTPREVAESQPVVGTLELRSERGRTVMRLWDVVGDVGGATAELWMPVLTAMFSDTFRLTGIEKAPGGAWVHQAWWCEIGGAWRHDERRAAHHDLNPTDKAT